MLIGSKGILVVALSAHCARLLRVDRIEVRTEGVEPSWPRGRRLLRPVRLPVPPHPHEEPRGRAAERAARRFTLPAGIPAGRGVRSRGEPSGEPLAARPLPGAARAWAVP